MTGSNTYYLLGLKLAPGNYLCAVHWTISQFSYHFDLGQLLTSGILVDVFIVFSGYCA